MSLLEMQNIVKRFPGVVALGGVSLHLERGEVLALMGENGAGKSTLMKVLGGAYAPDEGEILLDGQRVQLRGVAGARAHGIALIHQELMLAPNVDIAGNIFLGNELYRGAWPLQMLDRRAMNRRAIELLDRVGLNIAPTTLVSALTAGQMQMVEIAKALALNARLIIMDEPTSSLTLGESNRLFEIINNLRSQGIGIIYISHRLDEVLHLADRITVLRDGKYVGDIPAAGATHDKIVSMMVGRELTRMFPTRSFRGTPRTVLEVDNLFVPGARGPVSFSAMAGEIVGFAGLVGSGRTELMRSIFGVDRAITGTMRIEGEPYQPATPADAIRAGVYLAPEDRKLHGLVLPMSIAQNVSLPNLRKFATAGVLRRGNEAETAQQQVRALRIRTPSVGQIALNLSGGNQQKVVLGKWLAMKPRVLILDEPTRGIDVGAKAEIYRQMADLANTGLCILMVSSDMEEVLGMSDRVVVMHERSMAGIVQKQQISEQRIALMMSGRPAA